MKIKNYGAKYSEIVSISEELSLLGHKTNQEYLYLNRGVNDVVNIDLSQIIPLIDFNSSEIQVYPANNGRFKLKEAINDEYFLSKSNPNNILITAGGMNALKLTTEIIDIKKIFVSKLFWGAYKNIAKLNSLELSYYENFEYLTQNINELKDCGVIICDPNNPVGNKFDDEKLLNLAKILSENDVTVIFDSPYRRLFLDKNDTFYYELSKLRNVIILESFSKSIGLSGQRLGFIHSSNPNFLEEMKIHLLYTDNGVNAFAQILVEKLLTTKQGQQAVFDFKENTVKSIKKNIDFLIRHDLLAKRFYEEDVSPVGIFVIINCSSKKLLEHNIGSVSLPYFTNMKKEESEKYSRICVSVEAEKFEKYFNSLLKN